MIGILESLKNKIIDTQRNGTRIELHLESKFLLLRDCILPDDIEIYENEIEVKYGNLFFNLLSFQDIVYDDVEEYYILLCGDVRMYIFFHDF